MAFSATILALRHMHPIILKNWAITEPLKMLPPRSHPTTQSQPWLPAVAWIVGGWLHGYFLGDYKTLGLNVYISQSPAKDRVNETCFFHLWRIPFETNGRPCFPSVSQPKNVVLILFSLTLKNPLWGV